MEKLNELIFELSSYPKETEWIEFKHNNYEPYMIAEDISALANSAALHDKSIGYMLWGIDDNTHEIIGTDKSLKNLKKGNEELENWLRHSLSANVDFEYKSTTIDEKQVGILFVYKSSSFPVAFNKESYIRVGSYTKKLKDLPSLEAKLWDKLRNTNFEEQYAKIDLKINDVLNYLNYPHYFNLLNSPIPSQPEKIIHYLVEDDIVNKQDNGYYCITNLGALLFAKKLSDFNRLKRKEIRIIKYKGNNRLLMEKEYSIGKGYSSSLEESINLVEALTPSSEIIEGAMREKILSYPLIAVREVIANELIHQDFSVTGTGPIIEIFDDRIEFTNPGIPLIDIRRIIDNPPKSRNEKLASLMRRLKMCEELGTGWDKIALSCEIMQLPAPRIDIYEDNVKVTMFSKKEFSSISQEDKLWACYLHACIKHVQGEQLTNSSLRNRFGLKESSSGSISRLIKEAIHLKLIKPLDPETAPRYMKYIPIWA